MRPELLWGLGKIRCEELLQNTRETRTIFDRGHDVHAVTDLAKDNVAIIEPGGSDGGDEELSAVGVWSTVGHREKPWACVAELEVYRD